jgi:hypothetical protein
MRKKCDNKEGDIKQAHMFSRALGYKRRGDIIEGDVMEVRVYGFKCCDCCHLQSDFSSQFQLSVIVSLYKIVRMENTPKLGVINWLDCH